MAQQKTATKKEDISEYSKQELYLRFLHASHLALIFTSVKNGKSPISLLKTVCDEFFIYTENQYFYLIDESLAD